MQHIWEVQPHRPCQLLTLVCRYSCYYLTRNSLTYTAPVMVSDPALKMDITQARHPDRQHILLGVKLTIPCTGAAIRNTLLNTVFFMERCHARFQFRVKACAANGVLRAAQVGSLTSLFPIAYGFSKFVSGVLGARTSPTLMLSFGLMATAGVNLLFGAGNAMPWFMTFWAINGILQAGRPAPGTLRVWARMRA